MLVDKPFCFNLITESLLVALYLGSVNTLQLHAGMYSIPEVVQLKHMYFLNHPYLCTCSLLNCV